MRVDQARKTWVYTYEFYTGGNNHDNKRTHALSTRMNHKKCQQCLKPMANKGEREMFVFHLFRLSLSCLYDTCVLMIHTHVYINKNRERWASGQRQVRNNYRNLNRLAQTRALSAGLIVVQSSFPAISWHTLTHIPSSSLSLSLLFAPSFSIRRRKRGNENQNWIQWNDRKRMNCFFLLSDDDDEKMLQAMIYTLSVREI